jgi:hypothetical protein
MDSSFSAELSPDMFHNTKYVSVCFEIPEAVD